ncbi:hypothetical protein AARONPHADGERS_200 [Bacillus phage AaronPhadgers]|nr:hypothetical protein AARONPHADGERS_200 [Bacillus phage AaronPhadgers]
MTLEKHVSEEGTGFHLPLGIELKHLVREKELIDYGIAIKDIYDVIKTELIHEARQGKTQYMLPKDNANEMGIGCIFESKIIRQMIIEELHYNKIKVYRKRNDTLGVYGLEFQWEV